MQLCICGLSFSTVEDWSKHVGECWQAQQTYQRRYNQPLVEVLEKLTKVLEKLLTK